MKTFIYDDLSPEQKKHFLESTGYDEKQARKLSSNNFQLLSRRYGISLPKEPHQEPVDLQEAMISQRSARPDLSNTLHFPLPSDQQDPFKEH